MLEMSFLRLVGYAVGILIRNSATHTFEKGVE